MPKSAKDLIEEVGLALYGPRARYGTDLAAELEVSTKAVARWKNGSDQPSEARWQAILDLVTERQVELPCKSHLQ